jgi:hypothetical protein
MIDYKFNLNFKNLIKHKACGKCFFSNYSSIATRVPLKDLTHMFCL